MNQEFNLYCDESRHTSDVADRYLVIGVLSCLRSAKREIARDANLVLQLVAEIGATFTNKTYVRGVLLFDSFQQEAA